MKQVYTSLLVGTCLLLNSCSKNDDTSPASTDTNILSYSIENKPYGISISNASRRINITFPDTVMDAENLIADFTLSPGCKATIKNTGQTSGVSKNNYEDLLVYTVSVSGKSSDWDIISTNNTYTTALGLGNFLQQTASNNCSYPWYIDQMTTGFDSVDNCGPTATTMACKWSDSTFSKTPHDARMKYRSSSGWWYTDDIDFYLHDNNVTHSFIALASTADATAQVLKRQVDLHQLVILCLDMDWVRFTGNMHYHTDKFYVTTPGWGHFLVIKGYRKVSNEMFFEVYDPNSWAMRNDDGTLMGQDRYYRAEDLFEATKTWWPYAFIIAKKGAALTERPAQPIKNIPVQYGR